jgi:ABC-type antimicrobial peptide transport system permease subunit
MGSVFGLVAYLLEARRREFGVMLALGATHRHLTRSAVQTGLAPTALGAAGGAGAAMLFARTVESLLIGIRGFDLRTYAGTLIAFLVCATAACLIGAWRVRRIAPMDALRAE